MVGKETKEFARDSVVPVSAMPKAKILSDILSELAYAWIVTAWQTAS